MAVRYSQQGGVVGWWLQDGDMLRGAHALTDAWKGGDTVSTNRPTGPVKVARVRDKAPGYSSLVRGLKLLDAVAASGPARVDDLADALEMPVSTVYRYLRTFLDSGHVCEIDGLYAVGRKFQPPQRSREAGHLVRLAEPSLRTLREATREAAILTVRVETTALCLDRLMPRRRFMLSFQRGSVRGLYAGASALALLAWAPQPILTRVLNGPMRQHTAKTPRREDLLQRLANVREQGFAVSDGEMDVEMVGVGAPVFRHESCVCALSVAGYARDMDGPRLDAAVSAVLAAADDLRDRLESVRGVLAWTPDHDEPQEPDTQSVELSSTDRVRLLSRPDGRTNRQQ